MSPGGASFLGSISTVSCSTPTWMGTWNPSPGRSVADLFAFTKIGYVNAAAKAVVSTSFSFGGLILMAAVNAKGGVE